MSRHSKQRSEQHLIDESAQKQLQKLKPYGWVLRDYRPDYGIDYILEAFQSVKDSSGNKFETLGEHLFIQLKGKKTAKRTTRKLYNRYNIEKAILSEDKLDLVGEVQVISFSLEVSELVTIQRMGAALPVLLLLVELETEACYFICLNDYVEKILIPKFRNGDYASARTRTLHIPTQNIIRDSKTAERIFGWYAKRAKLFAAFQKMVYQYSELKYVTDQLERLSLAQHFAKILMRYDFWQYKSWPILCDYGNAIERFLVGHETVWSYFEPAEKGNLFRAENLLWNDEKDVEEIRGFAEKSSIIRLWEGLSTLPSIYEETCREWFLPTPHGFMMTYHRNA
ncbi:MAG: DUF4365 domain-containing protein [Leptolyngbyaceae cyanobacterium]